MPVRCTFSLNSKESSQLHCSGFGSVKAFSGTARGRDNPYATAWPDVGPLPAGTYYLVDRQSGGTPVNSPLEFDSLQRYIRSRTPDIPIPGSNMKAYGTG